MRAAWVLALLLLPACAAQAAAPRLELTLPPVPLVLPGSEATVQGNLTYGYDDPANRTSVGLVPVDAPAWLTARLEPSTAVVDASEPDGRTDVPVRLTVGVAAGTPALEQHTLRVLLTAEPNPPLDAANATASVVVRVGFLGRVRVEPVDEVTRAELGEPANIALRLVNEGNGPTRVTLHLPATEGGLRVLPPSSLVLEAPGEERTVNVSILAEQPGTYPVLLRFDTHHAFDPTLVGEGGEVSASVQVERAGVPGPATGLVLLSLALMGRRR